VTRGLPVLVSRAGSARIPRADPDRAAAASTAVALREPPAPLAVPDRAGEWDEDAFGEAILRGTGPLWLRCERSGRRYPLDVEKWCGPADRADRTLVQRCAQALGPVLDIGCGPGRLLAELLEYGVPALGVDLTWAAVARSRALGAAALRRSVFDRLPGEGRWPVALLADGNLGIGGDPDALLRRCAHLLHAGGLLLVEVEWAPVDHRLSVRVEDRRGRLGPPFRWARLGAPATRRCARAAGFSVAEEWTSSGRRFLALTR
jgi:SAM-dependent methyltransferase